MARTRRAAGFLTLVLAGCALAAGPSVAADPSSAPAAPAAGPIAGLPITLGDPVARVQAGLGTTVPPQPYLSNSGEDRGEQVLRAPGTGVTVLFNRDGLARMIVLQPPFAGAVGGLRLGDDAARLKALLGEPGRPGVPAGLSDAARRAAEERIRRQHLYELPSGHGALFETDTAGRITLVSLYPRRPAAPLGIGTGRPPAATQSAQRDAAPAAPSSGCDDPLLERDRFTVSELEIVDAKTSLVWFRCPALWVGPGGTCDKAMVLPSQTWASAMEVPRSAPRRRSAWRLASVEELDTIAAKGCGHLVNPSFIEIMFDTVWTRSRAGGNLVWRYGVDRQRVESPVLGRPEELFAQTIYVRDAP